MTIIIIITMMMMMTTMTTTVMMMSVGVSHDPSSKSVNGKLWDEKTQT